MTPLEHQFIDLADAVTVPPSYVIADLLPVGLTFMAGPPKASYKSTITVIEACMCARWVSNALPMWADCLMGGPTMMISAEASAGEVKWVVEEGLRIKLQHGAIYVATDSWDFQLDMVAQRDQLLRYLDERQPRLVIMDPFRNLWSGDENDSAEVIGVLKPIRDWLHANEAAGVLVHHVNKPSDGNSNQPAGTGGMYRMRGSSAIPGLADAILVIEPTNHEGQVYINATFKRGQGWRRRIQLGVPGYGWPSEGYEVLADSALAVEDTWKAHRGVHDMQWMVDICAKTKWSTGMVKEGLHALDRNAKVIITDNERRLLLG